MEHEADSERGLKREAWPGLPAGVRGAHHGERQPGAARFARSPWRGARLIQINDVYSVRPMFLASSQNPGVSTPPCRVFPWFLLVMNAHRCCVSLPGVTDLRFPARAAGQVSGSLASAEAVDRWGEHFLRFCPDASLHQRRNNFKDPGARPGPSAAERQANAALRPCAESPECIADARIGKRNAKK